MSESPIFELLFSAIRNACGLISRKISLIFRQACFTLILAALLSFANTASSFAAPACKSPPRHTINVLFIGPSFSTSDNLPDILSQIAASDPASPYCLNAVAQSRSTTHLSQLLADPDARKKVTSQHWDYIILQDNVDWPFTPETIKETRSAFADWAKFAHEESATPIIFQTWADQAGSQRYTDVKTVMNGKNFEKLQNVIKEKSRAVAADYNIPMIPIGEYWSFLINLKGAPNLYLVDGHTPSSAGIYFNALLFYRYLTGSDLTTVTFTPTSVPRDTAIYLLEALTQ